MLPLGRKYDRNAFWWECAAVITFLLGSFFIINLLWIPFSDYLSKSFFFFEDNRDGILASPQSPVNRVWPRFLPSKGKFLLEEDWDFLKNHITKLFDNSLHNFTVGPKKEKRNRWWSCPCQHDTEYSRWFFSYNILGYYCSCSLRSKMFI